MKSISSPVAWLRLLADPGSRLELDLHGVPALYFARPGWKTEPAPFDQHLICLAVSGSFRFRSGALDTTVNTDDLLWIQPGTVFCSWLPGAQAMTLYRFRLTVKDRAGRAVRYGRAPRITRAVESARRWIEEIVRTGQGGPASLQAWRRRGALLGLFADVLAPSPATPQRGQFNPLQQEALAALVREDATHRLTPARMAAHLRLSPDYFARLFRRTHAISPRAWLVRERIRLAAVRLLESQRTVGEVAEEFGYRDIYFFSRQFKQVMGRSPSAHRRAA